MAEEGEMRKTYCFLLSVLVSQQFKWLKKWSIFLEMRAAPSRVRWILRHPGERPGFPQQLLMSTLFLEPLGHPDVEGQHAAKDVIILKL